MNHWEVLGVKPGAAEAETKSAFRKKALMVHPDVGGSTEEFKRLYKAYESCLHEINVIDINLNEIFTGEHSFIADILKAMNINAFASSLDLRTLIGARVRFTFEPKTDTTKGNAERDAIEAPRRRKAK